MGGGDVGVERQGTRVQEAAAPTRAGVSSPYTRSARVYCNGTSEGNEVNERASESEESAADGRERDGRSVHDVGV